MTLFAFGIRLPLRNQFANEGFLSFQFRDRRIDFRAAEIVYWKVLDDFPFSAPYTDRERRDQSFLNAVTAIGTNCEAVPIVARRVVDKRRDAIHNRIRRGTG